LVFFVELFDELGDGVLFLGGGEVVGLAVVDAVKEGEEALGGEVLAFDVELGRGWVTDWTSCWVISDSHF
jgi:hypothetical protein